MSNLGQVLCCSWRGLRSDGADQKEVGLVHPFRINQAGVAQHQRPTVQGRQVVMIHRGVELVMELVQRLAAA